MNNFVTNVYENIFARDLLNLNEGSLVIMTGILISLNIKEKAMIFQSSLYL